MLFDFPNKQFFDEMAVHLLPRQSSALSRVLSVLFFSLIAVGFLWAIANIFLGGNIDLAKKMLNLTIAAAFLEVGVGHLLSARWRKAIAWILSSAGLALTPGILYRTSGTSLEAEITFLCSAVALFGFLFATLSRRETGKEK